MIIRNTVANKDIIRSSLIFEVFQNGTVVTIVKPSRVITDNEYNRLKPLIGLVGGFWREKYGGFSFNGTKQDVERKMEYCSRLDSFTIPDEVLQRSKYKFYPTPSEIAENLVDLANISELDVCLEPSAGQGSILDCIVKKTSHYVAVELDPLNIDCLVNRGYKVYHMPFEDYYNFYKYYRNYKVEQEITRVVMNPPFAETLCLRHVMLAYDLLAPGGILVTILPENALYYKNNKVTDTFNCLLKGIQSECKPMATRVFANMGVNVHTVVLVMHKT